MPFITNHYIPIVFDTVYDMRSSILLKEGMIAKTLGYYEKNDGGYAYYEIVKSKDVGDRYHFPIENSDGTEILHAAFINSENITNVRQFGAYGDGIHDDTEAIENAIKYGSDNIEFQRHKIYNISERISLTKPVVLNMNDSSIVLTVIDNTSFKNGFQSFIINITDPSYKNQTITIKNGKIQCELKERLGLRDHISLITVNYSYSDIEIDRVDFHLYASSFYPMCCIYNEFGNYRFTITDCNFKLINDILPDYNNGIGNTIAFNLTSGYINIVNCFVKNFKTCLCIEGSNAYTDPIIIEKLKYINDYNFFIGSKFVSHTPEDSIPNHEIIISDTELRNVEMIVDTITHNINFYSSNITYDKTIETIKNPEGIDGYISDYMPEQIDQEYIGTIFHNTTISVPTGIFILFLKNSLGKDIDIIPSFMNDDNHITNVMNVPLSKALYDSMSVYSHDKKYIVDNYANLKPYQSCIGYVNMESSMFLVEEAQNNTNGYSGYSADCILNNKSGIGYVSRDGNGKFIFSTPYENNEKFEFHMNINDYNLNRFDINGKYVYIRLIIKTDLLVSAVPDTVYNFSIECVTTGKNRKDCYLPFFGYTYTVIANGGEGELDFVLPINRTEESNISDIRFNIRIDDRYADGEFSGTILLDKVCILNPEYFTSYQFESVESAYCTVKNYINDEDTTVLSKGIGQPAILKNMKNMNNDVNACIMSVPHLSMSPFYITDGENYRQPNHQIMREEDSVKYLNIVPQRNGFSISLKEKTDFDWIPSLLDTRYWDEIPSRFEVDLTNIFNICGYDNYGEEPRYQTFALYHKTEFFISANIDFISKNDGYILPDDGTIIVYAYKGGNLDNKTIVTEFPRNSGENSFILNPGIYSLSIKIVYLKPNPNLSLSYDRESELNLQMFVRNFYITDMPNANIYTIESRFNHKYEIPIYKNGYIACTPVSDTSIIEENLFSNCFHRDNDKSFSRGRLKVQYPVEDLAYQDHMKNKINATSIRFNKTYPRVGIGEDLAIGYILEPYTENNTILTWVSSNPGIVTVDNGIVHGVRPGKATITVYIDQDFEHGYSFEVLSERWIKEYHLQSSIDLNDHIVIGDEIYMELVGIPLDHTEPLPTPYWYSSNNSVIEKVEESEYVTNKFKAVGSGIASIKAQLMINDDIYVYEQIISTDPIFVHAPTDNIFITASDNSFNGELGIGEEISFNINFNPPGTTEDRTTVWKCNYGDTKIAEIVSVIENGKTIVVHGNNTGTVILEARCREFVANYTFHIGVPLDALNLSNNKLSMNKFESLQLKVSKVPENTTNHDPITWRSSDEEIVEVSNNGLITCKKGGTATIYAECGGKYASCVVSVFVPLKSISLDKDSIIFENIGETSNVNVLYNPSDCTDDRAVSWKIDKSDIASVNTKGDITSKKYGRATVTATVGSCTASAIVYVNIKDANYDGNVFDAEMESMQLKINKLSTQNVNIIFISDTIYNQTNENEPDPIIMNSRAKSHIANAFEVAKYANADLFIHGGNLVKDNCAINTFKEKIKEIVDMMRLYTPSPDFLHGNIDYNDSYYNMNPTLDVVLSPYQRNMLVPNNDDITGRGYFYKDIVSKKIRAIYLNTHDTFYPISGNQKRYNRVETYGISGSQIDWLCLTLSRTPKDYSVIVFSHAPIENLVYNTGDAGINCNIVTNILEAYRNGSSYSAIGNSSDFPVSVNVEYNSKHDLIGVFSCSGGFDLRLYKNGVNYVTTGRSLNVPTESGEEDQLNSIVRNCKKYGYICDGSYAKPRTKFTKNEDLFDLISIDKSNRKIKLLRFGSGEDRDYSY